MPASSKRDLVYRPTIQGSTYFHCHVEREESGWDKMRKDEVGEVAGVELTDL